VVRPVALRYGAAAIAEVGQLSSVEVTSGWVSSALLWQGSSAGASNVAVWHAVLCYGSAAEVGLGPVSPGLVCLGAPRQQR
jgi:hypothetical protein